MIQEKAMRYSETTCEIVQPDNTTKLVSHAWLPSRKPRAVLVALHGGMAYGGDWMETALYFNAGEKNFFHIDSYDTYARDIDWYLRKVRLQHRDTPLFLLSHSNGALISLYYGLTIGRTSGIAGAVLSSPWLVNRVKVSPVLKAMARLIAAMHPRFEVTPKPVTDHLTHDPEITARHHEDEKTGLRGTTASAGLAVASEKAQTFVLERSSR
jgi:alpha-beta hydrolase superfamily lysophospholipase